MHKEEKENEKRIEKNRNETATSHLWAESVCVYLNLKAFTEPRMLKAKMRTQKQRPTTQTYQTTMRKKIIYIDKYTNGLVVKTFTIHFPISSNNAKHKHNKWFCYMDRGNRHFMRLLVFVIVCLSGAQERDVIHSCAEPNIGIDWEHKVSVARFECSLLSITIWQYKWLTTIDSQSK